MKNRFGFSVVEIIVAIAVISIISSTLLPTIGWLITKSHSNQTNQQAGVLLMEGTEIAYNVLQSNWEVPSGIYHPGVGVSVDDKPVWNLITGDESDLEAKFGRKITISEVCRDSNFGREINCTGAVPTDIYSKKITTEVTWTESGKPKSISSSLLVANLSQ